MKYYTGIGSRKTPKETQEAMKAIAGFLARQGFVLRSGGAIGADTAFEEGCTEAKGLKEIYAASDANQEAFDMASGIHPAWDRCSFHAKQLHARNCFQVLGKDLLTPSRFVICWTPGGKPIGGTRTAIVLAERNCIPVYNLASLSYSSLIDSLLPEIGQ